MDEIEKETDAIVEQMMKPLRPLLIHIKELESQLKPCDDEKVREIEECLRWDTESLDEAWQENINYLLSYIRRCQTEKLRMEGEIKALELRIAVLAPPAQNYNKTLCRAESAEAKVKELEEGIKKHKRKNKMHDLIGIDYELYKLVEE